MQTATVALLVLIIGFVSLSKAACPSDLHVNGCSIPLNAPFPYKALFKPVCNRHDVCYICGSFYGWTRDQCDIAFKRDMERKCTERYANRKRFLTKIWEGIKGATKLAAEISKWPFVRGDLAHCKHGAKIYYTAVNHFGKEFFESTAPQWCREDCARAAGNPNL